MRVSGRTGEDINATSVMRLIPGAALAAAMVLPTTIPVEMLAVIVVIRVTAVDLTAADTLPRGRVLTAS